MKVRITYCDGTEIEMTKEELLEKIRGAGRLMEAHHLGIIEKPDLLLVKEIKVLR